MKKIFRLFFIAFLCLFAAITLASCDSCESFLDEGTEYTIAFYLDYDSESKTYSNKLWETKVQEGNQITYGGSTPTKAADSEYTYTFKGWDHELGKATRDENFYALFDKEAVTTQVTYTLVSGQAATCEADGFKDYYQGSDGKYYEDNQGQKLIADLNAWKDGAGKLAKVAHTLEHHDAKEATPEASGNVEYWTCSVCNKYFLDAAGTQETTAEGVVVEYVAPVVEDKYLAFVGSATEGVAMTKNADNEKEFTAQITAEAGQALSFTLNGEALAVTAKAVATNNVDAELKVKTEGTFAIWLNIETKELWADGYAAPKVTYTFTLPEGITGKVLAHFWGDGVKDLNEELDPTQASISVEVLAAYTGLVVAELEDGEEGFNTDWTNVKHKTVDLDLTKVEGTIAVQWEDQIVKPLYGLVGKSIGWAADLELVKDANNENLYVLARVELLAGDEVKVRKNGNWDEEL